MAPEVAKHVAAVALFGKPSNGFLNSLVREAPPVTVGPLYAAKTIDQCIPADPVCSPTGNDNAAHGAYIADGMTDQAAGFAARLVASKPRQARRTRRPARLAAGLVGHLVAGQLPAGCVGIIVAMVELTLQFALVVGDQVASSGWAQGHPFHCGAQPLKASLIFSPASLRLALA